MVALNSRKFWAMHAFDGIRTLFTTIADRIAASRRASRFTCGDCERNEQRGLPPHEDCVVKAAQIVRDGEPSPRPPGGYYSAVWPR
jgi:hypothetical protein